ncbi:MAG: S8 family serine peptidase, partial [Nanoarchaeota archaeon]
NSLPQKVVRKRVASKVHTLLNESVPLILDENIKPGVEARFGSLNGSGTIIAVIDTGINKTHPDLNDLDDNPITNDPKVIGEFTAFPSEGTNDLHGHGTHVSGIASGTGEASNYKFVGVAPRASLINAKVLNRDGVGDEFGLLQGIEFALDNNADVISMSLGFALGVRVESVENLLKQAVEQGVVVVAAAGNSGDDFYANPVFETISSPGAVDEVITVGASCKPSQTGVVKYSFPVVDACPGEIGNESMVTFSSKGPSIPEFSVKPDVVAPGVIICSAASGSLNNEPDLKDCGNDLYLAISGTSMATPHVAGSAALLLQAHPDWNPEKIKSTLVSTAKDLNESAFVQGGGRIDVYKAVNNSVFFSPAIINLGNLVAINYTTGNVSILNNESYAVGIKLHASQLKNTSRDSFGNRINISENNFCLNKGGNKTIFFDVNATSLPIGFSNAIPRGHYDSIITAEIFPDCDFSATKRELHIPIGFSRVTEYIINLSSPIWFDSNESKIIYLMSYDGTGLWFTLEEVFAINGEFNKTIKKVPSQLLDSFGVPRQDLMAFYFTFNNTREYCCVQDPFYPWIQYPWLADEKWKTSFAVKGVVGRKGSVVLDFSESLIPEIDSNAPETISSNNLVPVEITVYYGGGQNPGPIAYYLNERDPENATEQFASKEFRIAASEENASYYYNNYYLFVYHYARDIGTSWLDSNNSMVIPLGFTDLSNVTQRLSSTDFNNVSFVFDKESVNPAFKGADFSFVSRMPEEDSCLVWPQPLGTGSAFCFTGRSLNAVNISVLNRTLILRKEAGCVNCNYKLRATMHTSDEVNKIDFIKDMDFMKKSIPENITLFTKPISLNLSEKSGIFGQEINGDILDALPLEQKIFVKGQVNSGWLRIITPNGTEFNFTNGTVFLLSQDSIAFSGKPTLCFVGEISFSCFWESIYLGNSSSSGIYSIDWAVDLFNNQTPCLKGFAEWRGPGWTSEEGWRVLNLTQGQFNSTTEECVKEIIPPLTGDVNTDCEVDVIDFAIVGIAFGSKEGDANWNPKADLNGDGVINIIDMAIIGVNFGRTC